MKYDEKNIALGDAEFSEVDKLLRQNPFALNTKACELIKRTLAWEKGPEPVAEQKEDQ